MKALFFLLALLPFTAFSQLRIRPCSLYFLYEKKSVDQFLKKSSVFFDFRKGDVVASIGVGTANREIAYSMMADSLTFYLQDINKRCLSKETITESVSEIYATAGRVNSATFIPVIGTKKETRLPVRQLDKILIENSLHEFKYQDKILTDLRSRLKPDGILYVYETITQKKEEKHQGCGKPMFTEDSIIALLERNGFRYVKYVAYDYKSPDLRIYTFAPAENWPE